MRPLSVSLDEGALRGHVSADVFRWNTLVGLVQEWADEETRADVIAALDNLAVVAEDVTDEDEIGRRIADVERVAELDPARVAVTLDELAAMRDQIDRVIDSIRRTHVLLGRVA
ncbi:hypothetical protein [Streptomyces sp. NPDC056463]|uniref:hypothetical protein n=1 Tax=Streptomyces sp. NPDC056463 TaxID=3345827 RepID=UPI003686B97A